MKPIVLSIIGAVLLSVSTTSSAYAIMPYKPTPPPAFICASEDDACKQNLSASQKQAVKDWHTAEISRRSAYNERVKRMHKSFWRERMTREQILHLIEQHNEREHPHHKEFEAIEDKITPQIFKAPQELK